MSPEDELYYTNRELARAEQDITALQAKLTDVELRCVKICDQRDDLQNQVIALDAQLDAITVRCNRAEQQRDEVQAKLDQANVDLHEYELDLASLKAKCCTGVDWRSKREKQLELLVSELEAYIKHDSWRCEKYHVCHCGLDALMDSAGMDRIPC